MEGVGGGGGGGLQLLKSEGGMEKNKVLDKSQPCVLS